MFIFHYNPNSNIYTFTLLFFTTFLTTKYYSQLELVFCDNYQISILILYLYLMFI